MPVVMPEPDHINELIRNEKRQYTKLRLSGKTAEDSISLNYGRLEISRLIEEKDTLRGIHVEFSDRCKYGTYVQLVNICNADAAASYGGYGNDFWIHPVTRAVKKVKIQTTDNYPTCGTPSPGYKSEQEADEIFRDKLQRENLNIVLARLSASFPFFGLLLVMQGKFLWRLFNHPSIAREL